MKLLAFCFLCISVCANSYKILVCYPPPIRSLNILGQGIVKHLLDAGHEVTYVTPFPSKKTRKNYNEIDLSSMQGFYDNDEADLLNISYVMANSEQTNNAALLLELGTQLAIKAMEHENLQALLQDKTKTFDAVIVDYLDTEIYVGLAAIYNCPMIWSYSMGPNSLALQLVDEPTNPAYTADLLSSNVPPFTFHQRVEELWLAISWNWKKWVALYPKQEEAYNRIFSPHAVRRVKELPKYQDVVHNASLVLCNFHHATGNIPKLPQNLRMIGGYHIEKPTKALPQDLQNLMDNSKHGVIYFSMGSTWKSKDIPKSITEGLLEIFGELKQTVIWKYEAELANLPKNVHIMKWAPQQSILAHPNLLFFISHGGLLSTTETIHFAVPQIGIPIYYDQFVNINRAVANGYAIKVGLNFELVENLKAAIQTMLTDPSYKERAKQLSSLYHDRPLPPEKELIWWVEHVIRTGGATHLTSPSRHMSWYQKLYLDLAVLIVVAILVLLKAIVAICSVNKPRRQKKKIQ